MDVKKVDSNNKIDPMKIKKKLDKNQHIAGNKYSLANLDISSISKSKSVNHSQIRSDRDFHPKENYNNISQINSVIFFKIGFYFHFTSVYE